MIAGIPVNYDESKVGAYTLPDPLKLDNRLPVRNAKTWNQERRPEIVRLFETQQYGVAPAGPRTKALTSTTRDRLRSTARPFASR